MNSIFNQEEASDLSRAVMDGEGEVRVGHTVLVILILSLVIASMFFVGSYAYSEIEYLGDVKEVDGVLYYPDGQPVRNYEQLNVYLNAQ